MAGLQVDPEVLEAAGRSCEEIRDMVHGVVSMVEPEMQAAAAGLPAFSTGGWKSGAALTMSLDGIEEETRSLVDFLDRLAGALAHTAATYRRAENVNASTFASLIGGR